MSFIEGRSSKRQHIFDLISLPLALVNKCQQITGHPTLLRQHKSNGPPQFDHNIFFTHVI